MSSAEREEAVEGATITEDIVVVVVETTMMILMLITRLIHIPEIIVAVITTIISLLWAYRLT